MGIGALLKKAVVKVKQVLQSALAGHAAWMMSSSGLQAVVAFGGNLILVWLLRPEDFGRFAIIQANVGLVAAIINFRINDLIIRIPEQELDDHRLGLYAGALSIQTFLVGSGALGVLWFVDLLNLEGGILLVTSIVGTWVSFQLKLYERRFEYKHISWIEGGSHFTSHAFAVLGALVGMGGLVLYLRSAVQVAGQLMGLRWVDALQRIPFRWLSINDWARVFRQIRGFWLDGTLESTYERMVVLTLGALAGETATGYFYQARRLALVPHQLLQPLTARIAYNHFSRQARKGELRSVLGKALTAVGIGLSLVCIGIVFFGDPIIPWVFGSNWQPVVPMLTALMGFLVGITLFGLLKAYFMAQGQMRLLILLGRGGQYVGFGILTLAVYAGIMEPGIGIALGVSVSYIAGVCLLAWMVFVSTRFWSEVESGTT